MEQPRIYIGQSTTYKAAFGFILAAIEGAVMKMWPQIDWYTWPLLALGISLLIWTGADFLFNYLKWSFYPNWSIHSLLPFKVLIPLDVAALKVYDANRNGGNSGHYIEILDGSITNGEDVRLQHLAEQMLKDKTFYGFYGLGTKTERVNIKEMGMLSKDCKSTVNVGGKIIYRDLKMEKRDLNEYIKKLRD